MQERIEYIEKNLLSGERMVASNLDGITQMEAQIEFAAREKSELQNELEGLRQSNMVEMKSYNEQISELEEKYKSARQDAIAVEIYKKKLESMEETQIKLKNLEKENITLKN